MILGGEFSSGNRKKRKEVWMAAENSSFPDINFSHTEGSHVKQPHNDALVVSVYVNNYLIKRMLIDDGSAVNVLTWEAFKQMKGSRLDLKNTSNPITSFCGRTI